MSNDVPTPKATDKDATDASRAPMQLPPVEGDLEDEPGDAGSPHKGQSGRAGSGEDAELQSIGQSQSDRAAGKSS